LAATKTDSVPAQTQGTPTTTVPLNKNLAAPPTTSESGTSKVDADLQRYSSRLEQTLSDPDAQILVSNIEGMSSQLKTANQRVFAAVIAASAYAQLDTTGKKGCDALSKVKADASNSTHAKEFNTLFSLCKAS
jgi:hypothetical protein